MQTLYFTSVVSPKSPVLKVPPSRRTDFFFSPKQFFQLPTNIFAGYNYKTILAQCSGCPNAVKDVLTQVKPVVAERVAQQPQCKCCLWKRIRREFLKFRQDKTFQVFFPQICFSPRQKFSQSFFRKVLRK